jgi:hypothetical protein
MTASGYFAGKDFARSIKLTADGGGGWVVDFEGKLWPFGNAPSVQPSLTWTGTYLGRGVL